MQYKWDISKPENVNPKTWRRQQIVNYLNLNPDSLPKDVLDWIKQHNPNPWPCCDRNSLGKIMRRLQKSISHGNQFSSSAIPIAEVQPNLGLCRDATSSEFQPLLVR